MLLGPLNREQNPQQKQTNVNKQKNVKRINNSVPWFKSFFSFSSLWTCVSTFATFLLAVSNPTTMCAFNNTIKSPFSVLIYLRSRAQSLHKYNIVNNKIDNSILWFRSLFSFSNIWTCVSKLDTFLLASSSSVTTKNTSYILFKL